MPTEYKRQEGQTYDSWLAIVVNSILLESGICGVTVSKQLLQAFKKKISFLHCAWKRAKGGNPSRKLLNIWKSSSYNMTIYYNELAMDKLDLLKENAELKGEKRSLENGLEMESDKRMKVEEKLTDQDQLISLQKPLK